MPYVPNPFSSDVLLHKVIFITKMCAGLMHSGIGIVIIHLCQHPGVFRVIRHKNLEKIEDLLQENTNIMFKSKQ